MMMEVLLGSLRPVEIIKNIQSLEISSETFVQSPHNVDFLFS